MNATALRTRLTSPAVLRRLVTAFLFILASALVPLVAVGPVGAQSAPLCTRFEAGAASLDNWGACTSAPNIVVTTKDTGSIGGAGDYYLHLRDTSGPSAACSMDKKYLGDWVQKMGGCGEFCFDFKLFKSGTPPASVHPSFSIYNGTMRAVFVANVVLTSADPWEQHICAPVNLIQNGDNLPSNSSGQWKVADSGGVFGNAYSPDWNTIITGVTMIAFPVDFTSDPSEEVGYDNLCMNAGNCEEPHEPVVTGCLKDSKVEVTCNLDGTYSLTLDSSSFSGDDITLTSETPGVIVATAQQPWSATTTWTLFGATPGQTVVLRANTTQIAGGSEKGTDLCCSGEIIIVIPECPKPQLPIDVSIGKENTAQGGGVAGFNIWITNLGAPITFAPGELIVTDVIPPGMTVTGVASPNWTCTPTTLVGPGTITCAYNLAGSLPTNASLADAIVIHDLITNHDQPLKNCAQVAIGASIGLDSNPSNNEACVEVTTTEKKPIDLTIKKGGEATPGPVGTNLSFTLEVTNTGAPFAGAGVIAVTDDVPAGVIVTSATGPDWICAPVPVTGPATLTCTYTGGGPTALGQSLGVITISGSGRGDGPFENCASVDLDPRAGTDTNADNNKDCVTVTAEKAAPACDPRTTKESDGACICLYERMTKASPTSCDCPNGTSLVTGKGCVAELICKAPLISNSKATACVCPGRLVFNGKACVKPLQCIEPAFPNKARTACLCPKGMKATAKGCEAPRPEIKLPDVRELLPKGGFGLPQGETNKP